MFLGNIFKTWMPDTNKHGKLPADSSTKRRAPLRPWFLLPQGGSLCTVMLGYVWRKAPENMEAAKRGAFKLDRCDQRKTYGFLQGLLCRNGNMACAKSHATHVVLCIGVRWFQKNCVKKLRKGWYPTCWHKGLVLNA